MNKNYKLISQIINESFIIESVSDIIATIQNSAIHHAGGLMSRMPTDYSNPMMAALDTKNAIIGHIVSQPQFQQIIQHTEKKLSQQQAKTFARRLASKIARKAILATKAYYRVH